MDAKPTPAYTWYSQEYGLCVGLTKDYIPDVQNDEGKYIPVMVVPIEMTLKSETLYMMHHETQGFIPTLWGFEKEGCEDRACRTHGLKLEELKEWGYEVKKVKIKEVE